MRTGRAKPNPEAGALVLLVRKYVSRKRHAADLIVKEEGKTLPVSYVGSDPLPDTFKDGAQCLIEGHAMPDGRFVAEQLQAKCASKYEAAPGGTESSQPASSAERKS